jgi:hypothetical protein|tara:strand:+ start:1564 stop:3042 length:1479 start_codon:yes stop_codon:yes gene_type:complete
MKLKQSIKAGLIGAALAILAIASVQAASDQLKSARMTNSTLASQIDDKVGDLETALGIILGITLDANVSAIFSIDGTGLITVQYDMTLPDSTALTLGTGGDVDIEYDGTDMLINPQVVGSGGVKLEAGTLYIKETADAATDKAAYGQIWVNTATPNELYFTDDAGTDVQLGTTVGGATGVQFNDNVTAAFGTGSDGTIYYDGTDMFLNPAAVGTGELVVLSETVINADGQTLATPKGTLHVHGTDPAPGSTPVANGDDLVVEHSGHAGISILTDDNSTSSIYFGDTDPDNGAIIYDHPDQSMTLYAGSTTPILALRDNNSGWHHISKGSAGNADAEWEVSDGSTLGGGDVHRAASAAHSSPNIKSDIRNLTLTEQTQAYADVKSLVPIEFRYKVPDLDADGNHQRIGVDTRPIVPGTKRRVGRDNRAIQMKDDPTGKLRRGHSFGTAPDSIKDNPSGDVDGGVVYIDDRILNLEMAFKELVNKLNAEHPGQF